MVTSLSTFRRSRLASALSVVTLLALLATLLPARAARAQSIPTGDGSGIPDGAQGVVAGSAGIASGISTDAMGSVDLPSGSARTAYPFKLPTARGDAQPSLGLIYDSSGGVGFAGVGWTLNLPSIVRKGTAGLPRFQDAAIIGSQVPSYLTDPGADDYYIDGQLLVPVQIGPPLPAGIPAGGAGNWRQSYMADPPPPPHVWVLYRREIDDGNRYYFDGHTWVEQTKSGHMLQFGISFDGSIDASEYTSSETVSLLPLPPTFYPNIIYRWNLAEDADASGNTVYYIWDTELQLLPWNPSTAGTKFLSDIYDTSSAPNATPTGPVPPTCAGPTTQSCGKCGIQIATCDAGSANWGPCEVPAGACTPGSTGTCEGDSGTSTCDNSCQWSACPSTPKCSAPTTRPCGNCGTQTSSCVEGKLVWGACTNQKACSPGQQQPCGGNGTQTCSPSCNWNPCVCPPLNDGCQGPTGLLDRAFGLFEGTAEAYMPPAASFAHHVHLTWNLPQYPDYLTGLTGTQQGLVGPYANSPIWKAPPFAQLATVDVYSATASSTNRELVREYQLGYTYNLTETRSYLESVRVVGDCDATGAIFETSMPAPSRIAKCATAENEPPTTFSYYGIPPSSFFITGGPTPSGNAPQIVAETPAYQASMAPDFITDLNGDAVGDLVASDNGLGSDTHCLVEWATDSNCSVSPVQTFLAYASMGFFGGYQSCTCTGAPLVVGPNQTIGSTIPVSSANGLLTYTSDDSMWSFSVYADWASTGRASLLQIPIEQGTNGNFTNPNPQLQFVAQLSGPSNGTSTLQATPALVAPWDNDTLPYVQQAPNNNFQPTAAFDVDGDGLPDMTFVVQRPPDNEQTDAALSTTLFSSRDHNGTTHAFDALVGLGQRTSPQISAFMSPNQQYIGGWYNPNGAYTNATHAVADIDGDGLVDEIILNKFDSSWSSGTYGDSPNYVGLMVLPNHGDGTFGVPPTDFPGGGDDLQWDWFYYGSSFSPGSAGGNPYGYYVVPGAHAPFAPYGVTESNGNAPTMGVPSQTGPVPPPQSDALSSDPMEHDVIRFGDLNGDGLADYAVLDSTGLHVCLRYGGFMDSAHWRCVTDATLAGDPYTQVYSNGSVGGPDPTIGHPTIMIADVDGSGMNQVVYFPKATGPFGPPSGTATAVAVNSHGLPQYVGGRQGLLSTVSNGLGAKTTFQYDSVHHLNIGKIPVPAWVVTSVETQNGLTGTQSVDITKSYNYQTPTYDARDRRFVGFGVVREQVSRASIYSPGTITTTTFATQTDNTCATACPGIPEALVHFSRGLPVLTGIEANNDTSHTFTTIFHQYGLAENYTSLDGRVALSLQDAKTFEYEWPPGTGPKQQATPHNLGSPATIGGTTFALPAITTALPATAAKLETETVFDSLMNPVQQFDYGVVGTDTPILQQMQWSLPQGDQTGWNYRLATSVVGYATSSGTIDTTQPTREVDAAYDALGRPVRLTSPLTGGYPLPGPGGGARTAGQPPNAVASPSTVLLEKTAYDANGNETSVGNQDNPCLQGTTYDPVFDFVPVTITVYWQGCGANGYATSIATDWRTEQVTAVLDPANRLTTATYDDFGRITELDQPNAKNVDATTKVFTATYADTAPIQRVTFTTGYGVDVGASSAPGFTTHYVYTDGLGEVRARVDQIDSSAHSGNAWTVSGVHDSYSNGRTAVVYQPMYGSGPSAPGTLPPEVSAPTSPRAAAAYDGLGRPVLVSDYKGNVSSQAYFDQLLAVVTQDPEQVSGGHRGSFTVATHDGHGRIKAMTAHWKVGPDGKSGNVFTIAKYLATGEPTSITQISPNGGSSRHMAYDSLGRLVQNTEPNAGTWTYAYDAEGKLVGTSDARGCGENIFYDLAGRKVAADYSPCEASQPAYTPITLPLGGFPYAGAEESYAFDPSTGLLKSAADRARHNTYSYDASGQVSEIDTQMALPGAAVAYGAVHTKFIDQYTVTHQIADVGLKGLALNGGAPVTETTKYGIDDTLAQIVAAPSGALMSAVGYDAVGRLIGATFGQSAPAATGLGPTIGKFGYDQNGTLTSVFLQRDVVGPPQTGGGYTPPPQDDPTLITTLTNLTLTPDLDGHTVSASDVATVGWPHGSAAVSQTYAYSDDYRLRAVTSGPADTWVNPYAPEVSSKSALYPQLAQPSTGDRFANVTYSYNWRGDVQSATDDANDFFDRSLGKVTLNAGTDQVASAATANASLGTQYDLAGNLTSLVVTRPTTSSSPAKYSYTWDELGRLATATRVDALGTATETFVTGASARGVASLSLNGGAPTYNVYVFDSLVLKNAGFAQDYEDDLSTEQVYLAGGLARFFNDKTGTMPPTPAVSGGTSITGGSATNHTFLNLRDARGSSAFVIDQGTGELVERTAYLPYGALDTDMRNSTRWNASREDLKYTGLWDESEVGLAYFNDRYYAPQLGRFISPDPLAIHGFAGDDNPYAYAYGSPIDNTDPSGLDPADAPAPGTQGGDQGPPPPVPGTTTDGMGTTVTTTCNPCFSPDDTYGGVNQDVGGPVWVGANQNAWGKTNDALRPASSVNAKAAPTSVVNARPIRIAPYRGQPLQLWTGYVADKVIKEFYKQVQEGLLNFRVFPGTRISKLTGGANPSWSMPDIADFGPLPAPAFVYEIKPRGSEPLAVAEALGYISQLADGGVAAVLGPIGRPGTGDLHIPGATQAISIGYATIYFSSVEPGTITYLWVWDASLHGSLAKILAAIGLGAFLGSGEGWVMIPAAL